MSRTELARVMPWRENEGWNPTFLRKQRTSFKKQGTYSRERDTYSQKTGLIFGETLPTSSRIGHALSCFITCLCRPCAIGHLTPLPCASLFYFITLKCYLYISIWVFYEWETALFPVFFTLWAFSRIYIDRGAQSKTQGVSQRANCCMIFSIVNTKRRCCKNEFCNISREKKTFRV